MNRTEFIDHLATLSAGEFANPDQIAAFKRYYHLNSGNADKFLVAVDEIYIGGTASKSVVVRFVLEVNGAIILRFTMNLYGGVVRWRATPDQHFVGSASHIKWSIMGAENADLFCGHISYIDQDGYRHYRPLDAMEGRL